MGASATTCAIIATSTQSPNIYHVIREAVAQLLERLLESKQRIGRGWHSAAGDRHHGVGSGLVAVDLVEEREESKEEEKRTEGGEDERKVCLLNRVPNRIIIFLLSREKKLQQHYEYPNETPR